MLSKDKDEFMRLYNKRDKLKTNLNELTRQLLDNPGDADLTSKFDKANKELEEVEDKLFNLIV